jgi:hypothetical protein
MTFTIEPMVNAGRRDVELPPDSWTVIARIFRCQRVERLIWSPGGVSGC